MDDYLCRIYEAIMDLLPFEARRPGGDFNIDRLAPGERVRVLTAVRRYLNLCSEELYLHERGKLDHATWNIWKVGIRDTFRLPAFFGAWELLRMEYDYFPQFCRFMDDLVSDQHPISQA